jgi:hypothetical protein
MGRVEVQPALLIQKLLATSSVRPPMLGPASLGHGPAHVAVIKGSCVGCLVAGRAGLCRATLRWRKGGERLLN